MKLTVLGLITVEDDSECNLAAYSALLIDMMCRIEQHKKQKFAEHEVDSIAEMLMANFAAMQDEMQKTNSDGEENDE